MEQGMGRWAGAGCVLVALAVAMLGVAGCGSGESTPLQDAEAEFRELHAESEEMREEVKAKSDEYLAALDRVQAMLDEQMDAALAEDVGTYRQNQKAIKAPQARSAELRREAAMLRRSEKEVERKLESAASRVEQLKGCDQQCQEARDRAAKVRTQCYMELSRRMAIERAVETCQRRYPMPNENVLKDVLDGE